MSGFLEEWLCTRLGVPIQFNDIGAQFFDGKLFFKILQSYDIVGPEVKEHFRRAISEEEALENLNLLRVCFKLLGVLKDEKVLEEIARKNGTACIQLLTELYLRLSNRNTLPFVTKEKEQQVLNQETGRFHKIKVTEKPCNWPGRKKPLEKLLSRLKTSIKVFSDDQSYNYKEDDRSEQQRLVEVSTAAKESIKRGLEMCSCKATVEDCLKRFDEKVIEYQAKGDHDRKQLCPPDKYVSMLKLKTLKEVTDKEVETKLKDLLIKKIFYQQMKEREKEFHCSLAEKLFKQSKYEREMAHRLGKIHLQHRMIYENRRKVHEEAQKLYDERMQTIHWRRHSKAGKEVEQEKQRLLDLHRKIYDERVAQARAEKMEMIVNVLNDLIDMSIEMSHFEAENKIKVPQKEMKKWKIMFFNSLPISPRKKDIVIQDEKSVEDESFDSFIEPNAVVEESLNENDLNEYLILLGPWAKELWPELEHVEEEMEVLGFIVHHLLEFKYPLPDPPKPADVPLYPVRVVLNHFEDKKALKTLKSLLEKPKIEIVEVPTLISFCIDKYKKEMSADDKKRKDKKRSEEKAPKHEKKGKKKEEIKFKSVEVQFPSVESIQSEMILSNFAEMGKEALDILNSGSIVPDELTLNIITEYLRNLEDREGWVLVNFPLDCRQVDLLEFVFTGINAPIKCPKPEMTTYDMMHNVECFTTNEIPDNQEDMSEESPGESDDKMSQLRTSRLVPRPNPPLPKYVYKPYFTRYINMDSGNPVNENHSEVKNDETEKGMGNKSDTSIKVEGESEEKLEELLVEPEVLQTPNSFYKTTNIHLDFCYKKLDLSTLKLLGREILDETNEPGSRRRSSVELFGELAKEKAKKASAKPPQKNKKDVQESFAIIEESSERFDEKEDGLKEKSPLCFVGEPCWVYTTPDIPNELMLSLASFWESIELNYINTMKELFLFYREHDATVVPYRFSIYNKLNEMMESPDNRQELVTAIQNELNNVKDTLRGNGEVKKELYCQIFELQLQLWDLCDAKKNVCDQERRRIIDKNWISKHVCGMFNLYISMMESELDRFVDSIYLVKNYYTSALGKATTIPVLKKWILPRYKCSELEMTNRNPSDYTDKRKSEIIKRHVSITKRYLEVYLISEGMADYFSNIFTNVDGDYLSGSISDNPFWISMNSVANKLCDEIVSFTVGQNSDIEKERKSLFGHIRGQTAAIKSTVKEATEDPKWKSKGKGKSKMEMEPTENEEETQRREMIQKLLLEWTKTLKNESDRIVFRISLLKNRFGNDLLELQELMTDTFHSVYNEIARRYFDQTKHCDAALKVLMASVEAETKIEPTLILTMDCFYVKEREDSLPQIPPPPSSIVEEVDDEFFFSIQQLYKVMEKMKSVSSLGITVESFIAILEDMSLLGHENGYPYLPKCWSLLNRNEIREIIRGIYGDVVVADWKDLLLFGLNFRFPTLEEIIEVRDKYLTYDTDKTETIRLQDYEKVVLWFEKELSNTLKGDLRIVLGKQFLFDLYRVTEDSMNYTYFLLNYCKDENPIDGLGKALALVTGSGYILTEDKLYLLDSKNKKRETLLVVQQIINLILMDTLNWAEGIVVTEVDDDGNPVRESEDDFVKNDFGLKFSENLLETTKKMSSMFKSNSKPENQVQRKLKPRATFQNQDEVPYSSANNMVWQTWIPKKIILNLLISSLQYYSLPEDKFYLQNHIEESLTRIYQEKGIKDCIQAHDLIQTPFMRDIFSKCFKFKICDLKKFVNSLANSKKISEDLVI